MGFSENTRGPNPSGGGGVLFLVLAIGAVVIALLTLQAKHAQDNERTPSPTPSTSHASAFTWFEVAQDDEVYPVTAYQVNPGAEDDPGWSCRTGGDRLCGESDVWTWGVRSIA